MRDELVEYRIIRFKEAFLVISYVLLGIFIETDWHILILNILKSLKCLPTAEIVFFTFRVTTDLRQVKYSSKSWRTDVITGVPFV